MSVTFEEAVGALVRPVDAVVKKRRKDYMVEGER